MQTPTFCINGKRLTEYGFDQLRAQLKQEIASSIAEPMANGCDDKSCTVDELRDRQAGVLKIVLAINAVKFLVEATGGYLASSTGLLSDSLDNLGDALT